MRIADVMKDVRKMNHEHGFESKGRELFCEKMLLIVSEISEALEEFRDGRGLNEIYFHHDGDNKKPEGIPIEIADAVIRIFDFCESNEINLEEALKVKMAYNETRPYKHNRQL
jgi:NTP pyrophosphatase (non-canonical NTP hydrolase)